MKFHLNASTGNVFTGYGPGYVEVNRQRLESNVLVTPDSIDSGWAPEGFAALTREHFAELLRFTPEIVIPQDMTVRPADERRRSAGLTDYLLDYDQEWAVKSDLDLSPEGQDVSSDIRLNIVNGPRIVRNNSRSPRVRLASTQPLTAADSPAPLN